MGRVSGGQHAEGGSGGGAADSGGGETQLQTLTFGSKANFRSRNMNRDLPANQLTKADREGDLAQC